MRISYIPTMVATTMPAVTPAPEVNQNMIEKAINNAIYSTIVQPFQNWLLGCWIKFVGLSYWLCLAIATTCAICAICGIPKAKSLGIKTIIFYIIIRMVSWYNGWC